MISSRLLPGRPCAATGGNPSAAASSSLPRPLLLAAARQSPVGISGGGISSPTTRWIWRGRIAAVFGGTLEEGRAGVGLGRRQGSHSRFLLVCVGVRSGRAAVALG